MNSNSSSSEHLSRSAGVLHGIRGCIGNANEGLEGDGCCGRSSGMSGGMGRELTERGMV